MPLIPYTPRVIKHDVPVLGTKTARIKYTSHIWDSANKRITINYLITIGELINTYDENDEIVSSEFIKDEGNSIISSPRQETFIADNDTFVDPATGNILKYKKEDITPQIEALPYMGQYDWYQMVADTQEMVIVDFIESLTLQKINNKEFDFQRYQVDDPEP